MESGAAAVRPRLQSFRSYHRRMNLQDWVDGGSREQVFGFTMFVREDGQPPRHGDQGRHLTFLHGYPTCSWDWSKIWPTVLAEGHRALAFDFIGFGHSEKPRMRYSYDLQLRCLEMLWKAHGVTRTVIVAHDYGSTAAQELLARNAEGRLPVKLEGAVLLNGGLFPALHRARPVQRALRIPLLGDLIARLIDQSRFERAFAEVFAVPPTKAELEQFWASIARDHGNLLSARLLHYMGERKVHEKRWIDALERAEVPLTFIWGQRDPVSGAHVMDELRRREAITGELVALDDAGHYPQWEQPEAVAAALTDFLRRLG